jgi:hypothetical protein
MTRSFGSWLSGAPLPDPAGGEQQPNDYPGQALGLPSSGPRSLAGMGRRVLAVAVDWLIALGLAAWVMRLDGSGTLAGYPEAVVEVIWFALGVIGVRLFSFTPGQFAFGLLVVSVDDRLHVGIGRAVVRGLLVGLVIPTLFVDRDGRGLQDRLTATAVARR